MESLKGVRRMQLTKQDFNTLLQGFKQISFDPDIANSIDYRHNILKTLANLFGYKHSLFWQVTADGQTIDPLVHNMNETLLYEYLDFFYHLDILNPCNLPLNPKAQVIKIADAMPILHFQKTDYFREFLQKYHYIDEMGIYLYHQNKLIAVIGLVRNKHERPFNEQDKHRLQFLAKPLESSIVAYETVINGYPKQHDGKNGSLTTREIELIKLVKKGLSNQEISKELFISINTVKKHLQNLYQKLDVANRTELCYRVAAMRKTDFSF